MFFVSLKRIFEYITHDYNGLTQNSLTVNDISDAITKDKEIENIKVSKTYDSKENRTTVSVSYGDTRVVFCTDSNPSFNSPRTKGFKLSFNDRAYKFYKGYFYVRDTGKAIRATAVSLMFSDMKMLGTSDTGGDKNIRVYEIPGTGFLHYRVVRLFCPVLITGYDEAHITPVSEVKVVGNNIQVSYDLSRAQLVYWHEDDVCSFPVAPLEYCKVAFRVTNIDINQDLVATRTISSVDPWTLNVSYYNYRTFFNTIKSARIIDDPDTVNIYARNTYKAGNWATLVSPDDYDKFSKPLPKGETRLLWTDMSDSDSETEVQKTG